MLKLLNLVRAVEGCRFKVITADAFDSAGKNEHVIADHAEAVGNEQCHEFMVVTEPLDRSQLRQMEKREEALQQTEFRAVDIL